LAVYTVGYPADDPKRRERCDGYDERDQNGEASRVSPKRFRQALRKHWRQANKDLSWHVWNERWTVETGSERHMAMARILLTLCSQKADPE
jgi:hypothetical protein